MDMNTEPASERISATLAPSVLARLDAYAASRRWSRSTAIAALIEEGLDQEDRSKTAPPKEDH
jgi:metal-responsive CopG/Arc/MetJ family transcriptional regulator